MSEVIDLAYDGTQATYHEIRRLQTAAAAKVISTATPWPGKPTGGYAWKVRPAPGTVDDDELTEL